jgi:hypothetical protein
MTDITQLLNQLGVKPSLFPPSSRYTNTPLATMGGNNGESIVYLKRRFVPKAENFTLISEHVVVEGERLDNIAFQYMGDPERFWQICDANNILNPGELTETPGNKIKITLPEGIQGQLYA